MAFDPDAYLRQKSPTGGQQPASGLAGFDPDAYLKSRAAPSAAPGMAPSAAPSMAPSATQQQFAEAERQRGREQMTHTVSRGANLLQGKDPNVDYSTGIDDPKLTAELSILTKPEQKSLLTSKFGAENIDTDMFGNWVLKPGGFEKAGIKKGAYADKLPDRPVAILPKDKWTGARAASLAGEVLPTAGAIAGGVIGGAGGAPTGPGALAAAAGGAALGAGLGESVNALIAQGLGIADRRPQEQAEMINRAMIGGAVGEGAARGLAKLGRATIAPYAEFVPLPHELLETNRRAAQLGLVPRVGAANPKSFFGSREQGLIEAAFGFHPEKKNIEILRREGEKLVQQTGGAPTATSRAIAAEAKKKVDTMALDFNTAKNRASQMVDDSIQNLQSKIGKPGAIDVQRDIEAAHKSFQDEASNLYSKVDSMVGDRPVAPTGPIVKTAQAILNSLPKTVEGKPLYDAEGVAVKFLQNLTQLPEMYSLRNMQALRSQLSSSAEVRSLLASTGARNAEMLRQATNDSFDLVSQSLKGRANKAVEALRQADAFYSKGMDKFDLPIIRKLTLDARQTGHVPPEQVLSVVTMPNAATNVGRIMSLVTPETRQAVRRAHFDSMLANAADPLTGKISGVKLAQEIKRLKTTFPALYGRDAQSIGTLANQLAALDGKLDASALKSGSITSAIKQAIASERALKDVTDDELFAQLTKPGFESAAAVDHLFRPGHPERITRAIKFFGEDSQQAKDIRALAMGKLLNTMEISERTRTGMKTTLSGKALEDELRRYGPATIDAMFGKEMSKNLHEFAKVAELATAKNPHLSTIAVAAIFLHPLSHVRTLADLAVGGRILSSPTFIKLITEGFKYPPPLAKGTAAFTRLAAMNEAIRAAQPGIGGDTLIDKSLAEMRSRLSGANAPQMAPQSESQVQQAAPAPQAQEGVVQKPDAVLHLPGERK